MQRLGAGGVVAVEQQIRRQEVQVLLRVMGNVEKAVMVLPAEGREPALAVDDEGLDHRVRVRRRVLVIAVEVVVAKMAWVILY